MNDRIKIRDLLKTIAAEPTPCDYCPHYTGCANAELACGDFFIWVHHKRITHEMRVPSRLWMMRLTMCEENETGVDFDVSAMAHYWDGVKDGVTSVKHPDAKERILRHGRAARTEFNDQLGYMNGFRDAEMHRLTSLRRWRDDNRVPGEMRNAAMKEMLGVQRIAGLVPEPVTVAERVAVHIAKAREPQAVFLESDKTPTVIDASHILAKTRIEKDPQSFIGTYAPSCPPEWILDDLQRVLA